MKVQSVFERDIPQQEAIDIVQKVYDNCWKSETILFNTMSQIVEICSERGSSVYEKIDELRELALTSLEESKQIGLTNPDLYGSELRKNSLSKQIKLARMQLSNEKLKCRVDRKMLRW